MQLRDFLELPKIPVLNNLPTIFCKDGTELSIQQSNRHYSGKNTVEIYIEMDVLPIDIGEPSTGDKHVYGWIPIEKAEELLNAFGGIDVEKSGLV